MRRIWLTVFSLIALVALGLYVNSIIRATGAYRELAYQYDGTCLKLEGFIGAEDLQIDHQTGWAFISNQDRRKLRAGTPEPGYINVLNMNEAKPEPIRLSVAPMTEFYPHGVSLIRLEDGSLRLFVISHIPEKPHRVEIFDVTFGTDGVPALSHVRTVTDDLLLSPNDLVAVGPEAFYFSNDHGSKTELGRTLEDSLRLPRSNIGYFDGTSVKIVADHMRYANGVNVSPDGTKLYVAEITGRQIKTFSRDAESGALELFDVAALNTLPDNIDIAEDGSLWIGAHPNIMKFVAHAGDPAKHSPSEIVRLVPNKMGHGGKADLIYLQDGSELSGSSVAAPYGQRFLIGGVFDPHILMCAIPSSD